MTSGSKGGPVWFSHGDRTHVLGHASHPTARSPGAISLYRPVQLGYDGRDYEIARRDRIARVAPIARLIAHESKRDAF
jgi:hypothetical protein